MRALLKFAVALAAVALPVSAGATTLVTATGYITNGRDLTGTFGAPGSLDGLTVTIDLLFDFGVGYAGPDPAFPSGSDTVLYGPTGSGIFASPGLSGTITINGISEQLIGDYRNAPPYPPSDNAYPSGLVKVGRVPGQYEFIQYEFASYMCVDIACTFKFANTYAYFGMLSRGASNILDIAAFDPTAPLPYDPSMFESAYGSFGYHTGGQNADGVLGDFRLTSLVVSQVPTVPEPNSWAMMLLGFGVAGIAARRNRGQATLPQAA